VLEAVEIEQQQGERDLPSFRPHQGLIQPIQQQRAVGQSRKLVVVRKVAHLPDLLLTPLGDLPEPRVRFGKERDPLPRGQRRSLTDASAD
jgi:hypothetical protein